MSTDLMIDIETYAASQDAVVLSIGAVAFDRAGGGMDAGVHLALDRALQANRCTDPKTVEWWAGQSEAARAAALTGTLAPKEALAALSEYMAQNLQKGGNVWANPPAFDLGILAHFYQQAGLLRPWRRRQEMCFRSIVRWEGAARAKAGEKHNALDDAIAQAKTIQAALDKRHATR